jgi:hypothetical protein
VRGDLGRALAQAVKDHSGQRAADATRLVRTGVYLEDGDIDLTDGGVLDDYEELDGFAAQEGDLVLLLQAGREYYAVGVVSDEGSSQPTWYGPYEATSGGLAADAETAVNVNHGIPGDVDPAKVVVSGHVESTARITWRASAVDDTKVTITLRNNSNATSAGVTLRFQIAVYP